MGEAGRSVGWDSGNQSMSLVTVTSALAPTSAWASASLSATASLLSVK